MAIRVLQSSVINNYNVTSAQAFYAGDGLILDTATVGAVRRPAASNNAVSVENFAGFATSDHNTTGNTIIQNDPVGSSVISADGTTFTSYANGWYVGAARRIGDYQDETVNTVTNLTDSSPASRRGVGVLRADGSQFVTDRYVSGISTTPGAALYIEANGSSAAANLGKLTSTSTNNGDAISRLDETDSTAGLVFATIVTGVA